MVLQSEVTESCNAHVEDARFRGFPCQQMKAIGVGVVFQSARGDRSIVGCPLPVLVAQAQIPLLPQSAAEDGERLAEGRERRILSGQLFFLPDGVQGVGRDIL